MLHHITQTVCVVPSSRGYPFLQRNVVIGACFISNNDYQSFMLKRCSLTEYKSNINPESLAKQRERFLRQKLLYSKKISMGQSIAVVYGPTPHPEITDLNLEPSGYKVIWKGSTSDSYPEGCNEKVVATENDPQGKAKVWFSNNVNEITDIIKTLWSIDADIPFMSN